MPPFVSLRPLALAAVIAAVAAAPALAEDQIVKPAPAAAPTAGPTLAAASEFCGDKSGKAEELIQRYSNDPKLKQVHKSAEYVAYSDDPKNPTVMYTFTAPGNAAHPAAVCRKPEKQGDQLVIKMVIVCDGEAEKCSKLRNDFNVMTARMQAETNQRIGTPAKQ